MCIFVKNMTLFDTELWIMAAKWEFECNNNPDTARNLIQRGLRFNNESKKLWLEVSNGSTTDFLDFTRF